MSASTVNNVDYALVGKAVAITASGVNSPSDLADGEIRLFTPEGTLIQASNDAADQDFIIAMGGPNSRPVFVSEVIDGAKLTTSKHVNSADAVAESEMVETIGYNGTANSIDVINDNLYMVKVYVEDFIRSSTDGRYIKHLQFKSDGTAAQSEIALGLTKSGIDNWSRETKNASGNPFCTFKAICNTAVNAVFDITNTVTITKGSTAVSVASDLTYNTAAGTIVAGDFIRFGATDTTIILTDDVYKVISVDSATTITLDRPMQLASGTRTDGNDGTQVITAAQGAAANWGIQITGAPQDHEVGKKFYKKTRFKIATTDFGSTVKATTYSPALTAGYGMEGNGVYESVADHEWFTKGFQGEGYRMGQPGIHTFSGNADSTLAYEVLNISWTDSHNVGFQDNNSPKKITIYTPTTTATYMNDDADGVYWNLEVISGLSGINIVA